jgi:hypothetical protein
MRWKSRKARLLAIVVVALGGVAAWGGVQVFAASSAIPTGSSLRPSIKPEAAIIPPGMTPLRSYVNSGFVNDVQTGGIGPVIGGPQTIHCAPVPPDTTCMVVADTNIQLGGGPGGNNRVAIVTTIDDNWITPGPFIGVVPPGYYQGFFWKDWATHVHAGTHVLKSYLYTDAATIVAYYSVQINLYGWH